MTQPRVEIYWGFETSEDARDIEEVFRSEGLEVDAKTIAPAGNGVGILIAISIFSVTVGAYLSGYFGAAGADGWKATKRRMKKLKQWFNGRYPSPPPHDQVTLILRHPETGVIIYISSEMTDLGFQKLHEFEPPPGAEYVWDEEHGEWRRADSVEGES
jgi:hypothetical protein